MGSGREQEARSRRGLEVGGGIIYWGQEQHKTYCAKAWEKIGEGTGYR